MSSCHVKSTEIVFTVDGGTVNEKWVGCRGTVRVVMGERVYFLMYYYLMTMTTAVLFTYPSYGRPLEDTPSHSLDYDSPSWIF